MDLCFVAFVKGLTASCIWEQVLHMDRNDYYGGESTSLNLIQVIIHWICKRYPDLLKHPKAYIAIQSSLCIMFDGLFQSLSCGRSLEEVISLQLTWVLVEIITSTWSLRCLLFVLYWTCTRNLLCCNMSINIIVRSVSVYYGKWCSCAGAYSHWCH